MLRSWLQLFAPVLFSLLLYSCPSTPPTLAACNRAHGDADCHGALPYCRQLGSQSFCAACRNSADCDDGVYCNGEELCSFFTCEHGDPLTCPRNDACPQACNEVTHSCSQSGSWDLDGDGHNAIACGGDDCDDADPGRYPSNPEVCDAAGHDEDCDPTRFGVRDGDGDGYIDASCCNRDASGAMHCGDDCDDSRPDVHPNLDEACDGLDNDCDGVADEGVVATTYTDGDGDGWGTGSPEQHCAGLIGQATQAGDCDDTNPQIHPGAFRCAGTGSAIDVCSDDGGFMEASCPGGGPCVPQPDGTGVCLPGASTECSDSLDNDGDGLVDWEDPDCTSPTDTSERPQRCGDGIDNDDDGKIDYPFDPGCSSREDTSEEDPATLPACANGIDDDGDGTRDFLDGHGDPGCVSAADDSEREASGPQCDNGLDDDTDMAVDFPADSSCTGPLDNNEATPACSNGIDDDGDGVIDYNADPKLSDPGCASAMDDDERGSLQQQSPACDDGVDNDHDGATDFPGDLGCTGPYDTLE
jgi:hypothetical protein